jgi:hypothetical protein
VQCLRYSRLAERGLGFGLAVQRAS